MRKAALSGAAMNIIIGLVSALIALILLWAFHEKVFTFFKEILPGVIKGFICNILGWLKWLAFPIGIWCVT